MSGSDTYDLTFTIKNTGGGTLAGSVSETCDYFSISSGGGDYSLGADDSVVVTVRYEPRRVGSFPCTVETGSSECSAVLCEAECTHDTGCDISESFFQFGVVRYGNSVDKTFTITNSGNEMFSGTIAANCQHYTIVSGGDAFSLDPAETRDVTVRFSPTTADVHECEIDTGPWRCRDVFCQGIGDQYWQQVDVDTEDWLEDIWGSSDSDIFAVGGNDLIHFDGSNWTVSTTVFFGGKAVWGTSWNDVYVVGAFGDIYYYNGVDWSSVQTGQLLNDVGGTASNDVYAVGYHTILHYNGSSWRSMLSSSISGVGNGVWVNSTGGAYTVGISGRLLYHAP